MTDCASCKRKFEVSNAPLNKQKKTSPNLFCIGGPREHNEFSEGEISRSFNCLVIIKNSSS